MRTGTPRRLRDVIQFSMKGIVQNVGGVRAYTSMNQRDAAPVRSRNRIYFAEKFQICISAWQLRIKRSPRSVQIRTKRFPTKTILASHNLLSRCAAVHRASKFAFLPHFAQRVQKI
jgi:hypothetical protein